MPVAHTLANLGLERLLDESLICFANFRLASFEFKFKSLADV